MKMKLAIVCVVLGVLAAMRQADSRKVDLYRTLKNAAYAIRSIERSIQKMWSYARKSYQIMQSVNRRDVDSIDLTKDGRVDVEELAKVIGAREARDLMEFMSDSSDAVSNEEFKRKVRDLAEVSDGNTESGIGDNLL